MARQETGWKFSALNASSDQLEDFKLEDMARDMQSLAPELWGMLGDVLSASGQTTEVICDDADDEEYWREDDSNVEVQNEGTTHSHENIKAKCHGAIVKIVFVLISIMLQSSNQKCNALQSIYGIFLHSCNTPQ
ncbi:uncharacterized protein EDB91DRAFT_1064206 [Suillus paluster]|uniref:uncharacterized protein n=1 Tax=Suillus paluster TaxID=48578 RepID=UPI001B861712|nr:uncharacterized protein EDB91DRAFT_1064206 [Suillus paluster]KAG1721899.1 hypothetical protein EDB91DRAFT_1064206 [Suillus paluster]